MRALNIAAALSGVLALGMLVAAAHALVGVITPEAIERIKLGAFIQLASAAAGLAIVNRNGRLNLIAGVLILGGAAVFSGALYALSLSGARPVAAFAPFGGIAMLAGWLTLAFAKPR